MSKYPLRVLSLGAGVQSTTILLMMIHGEIPKADHVIFADTGWEPKRVYQHLEWLQDLMQKNNMIFHIVSKGNLREDFLSDVKRYASMPLYLIGEQNKKGMIRRQCTTEYKLEPVVKKQRELAGLKPRQRCKEHRIVNIIGISYDESQRMRDPLFPWIQNEYPLIDKKITRQDCIEWCESYNYPKPPRSACIGCPYRRQKEWLDLQQDPSEWQDAVDFDNALRTLPHLVNRFKGTPFLHESRVPLSQADIRSNEQKGIVSLFDDTFAQECIGMCGN